MLEDITCAEGSVSYCPKHSQYSPLAIRIFVKVEKDIQGYTHRAARQSTGRSVAIDVEGVTRRKGKKKTRVGFINMLSERLVGGGLS